MLLPQEHTSLRHFEIGLDRPLGFKETVDSQRNGTIRATECVFLRLEHQATSQIDSLPPLVFRIFPLQFLLEFRVSLSPKPREILRDLDGTMVGREYVDRNSDALIANLERSFDSV
jgi:hypothetical protein